MSGPTSNAYNSFADLQDMQGEFGRLAFVVRSLTAEHATMTVVLVKSVTPSGQTYVVDVQPMVHQVDGAGNAVPHGTIHGLPVWRLQGGVAAVVVAPAVGDIGLALFAHSDISGVKRAKAPTTPGSFRKFDMSDGIYLGGVLNGDPTQSIVMDGANITINAVGALVINAPDGVTVNASGSATITASTATIDGNLQVNGTVTATGEGTFAGHTVGAHKHAGVVVGTGTSGLPSG